MYVRTSARFGMIHIAFHWPESFTTLTTHFLSISSVKYVVRVHIADESDRLTNI